VTSPNLYDFCGGDPVNYFDPLGLAPLSLQQQLTQAQNISNQAAVKIQQSGGSAPLSNAEIGSSIPTPIPAPTPYPPPVVNYPAPNAAPTNYPTPVPAPPPDPTIGGQNPSDPNNDPSIFQGAGTAALRGAAGFLNRIIAATNSGGCASAIKNWVPSKAS
jgi:hypothetical protein